MTLKTLNGVRTADPRYLCGSWASCTGDAGSLNVASPLRI